MTVTSKYLYWLPTLGWLLVIFALSARSAPQASEIIWHDFFIKKTAHFIEYAILTFLFVFSFSRTSGLPKHKIIIISVLLSVFYAFSDEYHQSFVPGRGPHLRDVTIDTFGSLCAGYFLYRQKYPLDTGIHRV